MFEMGFDDKLPEPEKAIENYKFAHYRGNSDATINLAIYYLSGRFMKPDPIVGKALLTQAYKDRNPRSVDCMLTYGLIKNKSEVDGFIQSNLLEGKGAASPDFGKHNLNSNLNVSDIVPSNKGDGEQSVNAVLYQAGLLKTRTMNDVIIERSGITYQMVE
tara:strand:+ start:423 stop:902 length:480 start_codon:yes stop_codon:yes gene_type:complete